MFFHWDYFGGNEVSYLVKNAVKTLPEMKSSIRKPLRMQIFHKDKNIRSKNQTKNRFNFSSALIKANINRVFFMAKRNFILGLM